MLIWSRWGFFVFLFFGAGVGLGFVIKALAGVQAASGPSVPMFIGLGEVISAVGLFFFHRSVLERRLDKPRPASFLQPLPEPVVHANGVRQTHQQLPVLHPQTGEQIWTRPRSTFFFVPVTYWPYLLAAFGVVLFVIGVVGSLSGS